MERRAGHIRAYRRLLEEANVSGERLREAKSHLSPSAERLARILHRYDFPMIVPCKSSLVIYVIFCGDRNSERMEPFYVGSTYMGIKTRFLQHAQMAWGNPHDLRDDRRNRLYTWMGRFNELQDHISCIPILQITGVEETARDFHTVAAPLERQCIILFHSHFTMGGLNSVWPRGPCPANPLLPEARRFLPLQYVFARARDQEDGIFRPALFKGRRYRNYFRRLRALSNFIRIGRSQEWMQLHLMRFRAGNLTAMYAILGFSPIVSTEVPPEHFFMIHSLLEAEIQRRAQLSRQRGEGRERRRMTFAVYTSRIWDMLDVPGIFDAAAMDRLPPQLQNVQPLVTFKNILPLHRRVSNKRHFFQGNSMARLHEIAAGPCSCMTLPERYRSAAHGGHVITADVQCAAVFLTQAGGIHQRTATNVVNLLEQGTNYRPLGATHLTPNYTAEIIAAWKRAVTTWVQRLCTEYRCSITAARPFIEFTTARFNRAIHSISNGTPVAFPGTLRLGQREQRAFRVLGTQFIIATCDKASQNFSLVCQKLGAQQLLLDLELSSNEQQVYVRIANQPLEDCVDQLVTTVENFHLQVSASNRCLPYYAGIPKFHKTPVSFRWLTIGSQGVFKPLYQRTQEGCKALKPFLKLLWEQAVRNAGVPVAWRPCMPELKNSREAVFTIKDCNHNLGVVFGRVTRDWLRTEFPDFNMTTVPVITRWDITRLYTNVPQEELVQAATWCVDRVFDMASINVEDHPHHRIPTPFLLVSAQHHEWLRAEPQPPRVTFTCPRRKVTVYVFTRQRLIDMITTAVKGGLFQAGDTVFSQRVGVPMGASCSPDLVNLFAFYYEYRFLTSVLDLYRGDYLQQQQAKLLLLNIRFMRRFLDDIILPTVFPDRALIHALFTLGGLVPGVLKATA
jgi:hypothetical protein